MNKLDKIISILEEDFNIPQYNNEIELETWTNGGVNMLIYIDSNKDFITQFEEYIENFDIDEEIDLHRKGADYRQAFTITESVDDFRSYVEWLKDILEKLKEVQ